MLDSFTAPKQAVLPGAEATAPSEAWEKIETADKRGSTQIETKVIIGVHLRASVVAFDLFTPSLVAVPDLVGTLSRKPGLKVALQPSSRIVHTTTL